jgi:hypothetical protein
MIMTRDKARKTATRQRMAETGEPYTVARRITMSGGDVPFEEQYALEAREAGVSEAEIAAQERAELAEEEAGLGRRRHSRPFPDALPPFGPLPPVGPLPPRPPQPPLPPQPPRPVW